MKTAAAIRCEAVPDQIEVIGPGKKPTRRINYAQHAFRRGLSMFFSVLALSEQPPALPLSDQANHGIAERAHYADHRCTPMICRADLFHSRAVVEKFDSKAR